MKILPRAGEHSHNDVEPEAVPIAGRTISICLSLITLSIIAICLSRRIPYSKNRWMGLPYTSWLIIVTYIDSFTFVFASAIVKDLGVNESQSLCQGAIILCLACYLTTKILIYLFLVEKAHIVRGRARRLQDKVYIFNCVGLMIPYLGIAIINFVFRIGYINKDGRCIIGMEKKALMPLIIFDVLINVYLTILFLIPLRKLYSYQNNTNPVIRTMAIRTFIGACCTTVSSVVNLSVLTALDGEPGWICLLACNADVLFSILVLHWITVTDKKELMDSSYVQSHSKSRTRGTNLNISTSREVDEYKGRATISTRVTGTRSVDDKDPHCHDSPTAADFPLDAIKVNKVYTQDIEMRAPVGKNMEQQDWSGTHTGRDTPSRGGSTESTHRIV